ncbi:MAG: hypothetical protein EXS15_08725 [Phycisphaerales bacterium]|nr:hypothetical protein [Phycisphaerales bacterium]
MRVIPTHVRYVRSGRRAVRPWSAFASGFLALACVCVGLACAVGGLDIVLRWLQRAPLFAGHVFPCAADDVEFAGLKVSGSSIVFILDKSGSMGGQGGHAAEDPALLRNNWGDLRRELSKTLSTLPTSKSFALYLFDDRSIGPFPSGLATPTPEAIGQALAWFDQHPPNGGTDPSESLKHALTTIRAETIILMSDGMFADTPATMAVLEQFNVDKKTRVNTVSFPGGDESVRETMKLIASLHGGAWVEFTPDSTAGNPIR